MEEAVTTQNPVTEVGDVTYYGDVGDYDDVMCDEEMASGAFRVEFVVVLAVYSLVGFVGNLLILIVYGKSKNRLSHSVYVYTLGIIDFTVCCVIIPYTVAYERHLITSDVICRGLEMLRHILVTASNSMMIVIALERYMAVFRPWRVRTKKKVRTEIAVVFVYSIIAATPAVMIFAVTESPDVYIQPVTSSSHDVTNFDVTTQATYNATLFTQNNFDVSDTFVTTATTQTDNVTTSGLTQRNDMTTAAESSDVTTSASWVPCGTTLCGNFSTLEGDSSNPLSPHPPEPQTTTKTASRNGASIQRDKIPMPSPPSSPLPHSPHESSRPKPAPAYTPKGCVKRKFCQYTTEVLGEAGALSYQLFLVLEYFLAVFILVVVYGRVYRQIWLRQQWRKKLRSKIGAVAGMRSAEPNRPAPTMTQANGRGGRDRDRSNKKPTSISGKLTTPTLPQYDPRFLTPPRPKLAWGTNQSAVSPAVEQVITVQRSGEFHMEQLGTQDIARRDGTTSDLSSSQVEMSGNPGSCGNIKVEHVLYDRSGDNDSSQLVNQPVIGRGGNHTDGLANDMQGRSDVESAQLRREEIEGGGRRERGEGGGERGGEVRGKGGGGEGRSQKSEEAQRRDPGQRSKNDGCEERDHRQKRKCVCSCCTNSCEKHIETISSSGFKRERGRNRERVEAERKDHEQRATCFCSYCTNSYEIHSETAQSSGLKVDNRRNVGSEGERNDHGHCSPHCFCSYCTNSYEIQTETAPSLGHNVERGREKAERKDHGERRNCFCSCCTNSYEIHSETAPRLAHTRESERLAEACDHCAGNEARAHEIGRQSPSTSKKQQKTQSQRNLNPHKSGCVGISCSGLPQGHDESMCGNLTTKLKGDFDKSNTFQLSRAEPLAKSNTIQLSRADHRDKSNTNQLPKDEPLAKSNTFQLSKADHVDKSNAIQLSKAKPAVDNTSRRQCSRAEDDRSIKPKVGFLRNLLSRTRKLMNFKNTNPEPLTEATSSKANLKDVFGWKNTRKISPETGQKSSSSRDNNVSISGLSVRNSQPKRGSVLERRLSHEDRFSDFSDSLVEESSVTLEVPVFRPRRQRGGDKASARAKAGKCSRESSPVEAKLGKREERVPAQATQGSSEESFLSQAKAGKGGERFPAEVKLKGKGKERFPSEAISEKGEERFQAQANAGKSSESFSAKAIPGQCNKCLQSQATPGQNKQSFPVQAVPGTRFLAEETPGKGEDSFQSQATPGKSNESFQSQAGTSKETSPAQPKAQRQRGKKEKLDRDRPRSSDTSWEDGIQFFSGRDGSLHVENILKEKGICFNSRSKHLDVSSDEDDLVEGVKQLDVSSEEDLEEINYFDFGQPIKIAVDKDLEVNDLAISECKSYTAVCECKSHSKCKSHCAVSECKSHSAVSECKSHIAVCECKSHSAVCECKFRSECKSHIAVCECKSHSAVCECKFRSQCKSHSAVCECKSHSECISNSECKSHIAVIECKPDMGIGDACRSFDQMTEIDQALCKDAGLCTDDDSGKLSHGDGGGKANDGGAGESDHGERNLHCSCKEVTENTLAGTQSHGTSFPKSHLRCEELDSRVECTCTQLCNDSLCTHVCKDSLCEGSLSSALCKDTTSTHDSLGTDLYKDSLCKDSPFTHVCKDHLCKHMCKGSLCKDSLSTHLYKDSLCKGSIITHVCKDHLCKHVCKNSLCKDSVSTDLYKDSLCKDSIITHKCKDHLCKHACKDHLCKHACKGSLGNSFTYSHQTEEDQSDRDSLSNYFSNGTSAISTDPHDEFRENRDTSTADTTGIETSTEDTHGRNNIKQIRNHQYDCVGDAKKSSCHVIGDAKNSVRVIGDAKESCHVIGDAKKNSVHVIGGAKEGCHVIGYAKKNSVHVIGDAKEGCHVIGYAKKNSVHVIGDAKESCHVIGDAKEGCHVIGDAKKNSVHVIGDAKKNSARVISDVTDSSSQDLSNDSTRRHRANKPTRATKNHGVRIVIQPAPAEELHHWEEDEHGHSISTISQQHSSSTASSSSSHNDSGGSKNDSKNNSNNATPSVRNQIAPTPAQSPTPQTDTHKKAGTMLFITTLICLLTWLPFWIDVFGVTDNLTFRYTFLLGHVTNPLVYGVVNTKVREEFKRWLACR